MAWTILLVLMLALFAGGFVWPVLWWAAMAFFVTWVGYFLVAGMSSERRIRDGDTDFDRSRRRTG